MFLQNDNSSIGELSISQTPSAGVKARNRKRVTRSQPGANRALERSLAKTAVCWGSMVWFLNKGKQVREGIFSFCRLVLTPLKGLPPKVIPFASEMGHNQGNLGPCSHFLLKH